MASTRKDLKKQARELLLGRYGFFAGTHLLYFLVSLVVNQLLETIFPNWRTSLLYVCALFITVLFLYVFQAGLYRLYLDLCRRQTPRYRDMAYGFTHDTEHILLFYFFLFLSLFVFFFLLSFLWELPVPWPLLLLFTGLLAGLYLYFILGFALVPYLYTDNPWKGTRELMKESRKLMEGRKLAYFLLNLSFLGLFALSVLSLGLGLLWLVPYMQTCKALFYMEVISDPMRYEPVSGGDNYNLEWPALIFGISGPAALIWALVSIYLDLYSGLISLLNLYLLLIPIPMGALSILLGLLSRGRYSLGGKGKAGLIAGIIGLLLTFSIFIGSFAYTYSSPQLRPMLEYYREQFQKIYDMYNAEQLYPDQWPPAETEEELPFSPVEPEPPEFVNYKYL